ncbi:MAG TPA: chemotaxis-specific protein-glutamate methyltransferase CheB [Vicinamibacterales bacterium]|nr:chemotaxis-specific protein-glutamate methyltransferase CheB [Vicinamibacterales bacterium]
MKKIGVLVVEDSPVVQQLLEHIIKSDPRLTVAGITGSAEEALAFLAHSTPDVISLDIRLPGMNGFEATRRIMQDKPTPIVVCSASVESADLQITMTALRAGALAVVEKPVGTGRADYERLAKTLCTQLVIMSDVKVVRQRPVIAASAVRTAPVPLSARERLRVLGIGASTGGPNAIVQILNELGASFPLPILLVQHIVPAFLPGFATWLQDVTPFQALVATNGTVPIAGTVYLAPPDRHMQLEGARLALTDSDPESMQRPSATTLFRSLARSAGASAAGVLLTGMGDDGAAGLLALRQAGGYTVAEHESTAVVYGMPKAAVDCGAAVECLPLGNIAPRLRELILQEPR